ncbi:MAG: hypothetical protein OER86_03830 [Phycisphaerae bacterium]|nr:hypothetical protein [Phycisphaerae bacterium]
MRRFLTIAVVFCLFGGAPLGVVAVDPDAAIERPGGRPDDFAIIFIMGYAGDHFPKDAVQFEALIKAVKGAHYNTVLCKYEPWRAEICRKHGIKIMPDLLVPEHHVYKNAEGAKALCRSLKGSDVVYAYHIWSDRIGGTVAGRSRDLKNVRQWDATHPVYVGSYNARALADLQAPDLIGYYDFHWQRGGHWRHLSRAMQAARKTDSFFLKYAHANPGRIGVGNYNRVMYTISTSLAFGLKGYMYHHTGEEIDKQTQKWKPLGRDLARVNAEVARLGPELMRIGNPVAVYSTAVTRTAKDRPTGREGPAVPEGLQAIPENAWFQVRRGEAVIGVFDRLDEQDVILVANHNAYQAQPMDIRFLGGVKSVGRFDRRAGRWVNLTLTEGEVRFEVPAAAMELVRVER